MEEKKTEKNRKSGRKSGKRRDRNYRKKKKSSSENKSSKQKAFEKKSREIASFLKEFDIDEYRERARMLSRRFVLHVGPTNSGKTYDSIQALKKAETGVYLGPLRLLALEMYDTLNADGVKCELLTGEEYIYEEDAKITSSTIELASFTKRYDVAVIDEAQMISDPFRGGSWTKALFLVDAAEVHVCFAPEAEDILCRILDGFDAEYEIVRHERLAPLIFKGKIESVKDVRDGDAVIMFSRRNVLAIAGELQSLGKKASVIYGALPPASRREEVRKFSEGENTVVVATDAIGMGISLKIKRIVFLELTKFDGEKRRMLTGSEIRQIAGRAGRYGIYDEGEVVTMLNQRAVKRALTEEVKSIDDITIPFPREVIETGYSFIRLFDEWGRLPVIQGYTREDMSEAKHLLKVLGGTRARKLDRDLLYDLVTCPVDIKNEKLVWYWLSCCEAIIAGNVPDIPHFETKTLEGCELQYKAYDVRHQLLRRIGIEDPRMEEKQELCRKINKFLLTDKKNYQKKCRYCGKPLPATYRFGICDECYRNMFG